MEQVLIRNHFKSYTRNGDTLTPTDPIGVELYIDKVINDSFFEFTTHRGWKAYGFFNELKNIWCVTETIPKEEKLTNSLMSTCWTHRKRSGIYENKIALIDANGVAMNYRIPRNASTAVVNSLAKTQKGFKVSEFIPWPNASNKIVVKLEDINNEIHDNRKKFFVYRDPVKRLLSYSWMILKMRWLRSSKYHTPIVEKMYPNLNDTVYMLLKVIEANTIFNLEDEYHLNTQAYTINALGDVRVDYMVDIKDIKQFFENELKIEFVYKTTTKPNDIYKVEDLSDKQIEEINRVLKCDTDLFNKFKDKLYIPN